jgi:squalene-hopene/tetraprenyl-beta-curcumene cyclase
MNRTTSTLCALAAAITLPHTIAAADNDRLTYQYKSAAIQIPAAAENEPIRTELSAANALDYLDRGAIAWQQERKCISCHTNGTYLLTRPMMASRIGTPNDAVRAFFEAQVDRLDAGEKLPAEQVVYLAAGLATDDAYVQKKLSDKTVRAIRHMFSIQNDQGAWKWPTCWPPLEDSEYHGATVAAMAVGTAPGLLDHADDPPIQKGVQNLRRYFAKNPPTSDYHRILLLWAECRLPGLTTPEQKQGLIDAARRAQRPDGGWSLRTLGTWDTRRERLDAEPDRDDPPSDGHATGLAIAVLREAQIPADHPQLIKGINWLKTNQRHTGRWWTRSLNNDRYNFITYSGTCYPLLALHACDQWPESAEPRADATGR